MRSFSPLVKAALSGGNVTARWIARVVLPSGTYCLSDGPDDLVWDNGSGPLTYKGFDQAFAVTLASSTAATKNSATTLSLSGTDPHVLASLFAEDYRGAPADVCLLLFDPATGLPGEELLMARGLCDVASISDTPAKPTDPTAVQISTLSLTIAPQTVDLNRPGVRLATDVDQRLHRDANDGFFKDVALAGTSQISWGKAGPSAPVHTGVAGAGSNNVALNAILAFGFHLGGR